MGQVREVDAISDAIAATEREIAGDAWDIEETDALDETGDRALESMGEGLEGQHEAGEDEGEADGSEEQDGESEDDGEGKGEGEADGEGEAESAEGKDGKGSEEQQRQQTREQDGRIPPGKHRELRQERDAIKAERDTLKAEIETLKAAGGNRAEIEQLKGQIATLTQSLQGLRAPQQRTEAEPAKPDKRPDLFENPDGFVDHLQKGFETKLDGVLNAIRQNNVSMSFELAHVRHGEAFPKAMEAINKLDANNPQDRQVVQSIYNSQNPGEALVHWHKNSEAMREVAGDIAGYRERIQKETRESLAKDPEFIKSIVASLRGEAAAGDNGSPRTANRLPPSLKRAPGASSQAERFDHSASDDSDQAVADAAWR